MNNPETSRTNVSNETGKPTPGELIKGLLNSLRQQKSEEAATVIAGAPAEQQVEPMIPEAPEQIVAQDETEEALTQAEKDAREQAEEEAYKAGGPKVTMSDARRKRLGLPEEPTKPSAGELTEAEKEARRAAAQAEKDAAEQAEEEAYKAGGPKVTMSDARRQRLNIMPEQKRRDEEAKQKAEEERLAAIQRQEEKDAAERAEEEAYKAGGPKVIDRRSSARASEEKNEEPEIVIGETTDFEPAQEAEPVVVPVESESESNASETAEEPAQEAEPVVVPVESESESNASETAEEPGNLLEKYADELKDLELSPEQLKVLEVAVQRIEGKQETAVTNFEQKAEEAEAAIIEVLQAGEEVEQVSSPSAIFLELEEEAMEDEDNGNSTGAEEKRSIFAKLVKYSKRGGRLTRKGQEPKAIKRQNDALKRIGDQGFDAGRRTKRWLDSIKGLFVEGAHLLGEPFMIGADTISGIGAAGDVAANAAIRPVVFTKDAVIGGAEAYLSNKVNKMIKNVDGEAPDPDAPFYEVRKTMYEKTKESDQKIASLTASVAELNSKIDRLLANQQQN